MARIKQSKEWEQRHTSYFEKDVYPLIGNKPIHEIDSIDIKNVLDSTMARIKKSGRGTGEVKGIFVRQIIGEIMEYAIITKRISIDPIEMAVKVYIGYCLGKIFFKNLMYYLDDIKALQFPEESKGIMFYD
nr:hypothetical protein F987_04143 [Acinetobacter gyllenbergii NIPH 230]